MPSAVTLFRIDSRAPVAVHPCDELSNVRRRELVDGPVSEHREHATERGPVLHRSRLAYVDAAVLPTLSLTTTCLD
jgi:hypothetical protein